MSEQQQSLKDRLAGIGRRAASAEGARNIADASAAKAGELRARIKARIEQLGRDGADLGAVLNAKVEELLKPRAAEPPSSPLPPPPHRQSEPPGIAANEAARDPTNETPEAMRLASAAAPATTAALEPAAARETVITRTFGRVGLTAVHARLGALAKVRKKAASASAKSAADAPAISRIDADMPALDKVAVASVAAAEAGAVADHTPSIAPPYERPRRSKAQEATRRRRATGKSRMAGLAFTLAMAVVTAALVHVATTLAMPVLSSWFGKGTAYDRLRFKLDANMMKQLPVEVSSAQPLLPFLTPDMHYAFCRYDISSASVQVTAVLPDVGWSLALYTPQGDNFYAAPGLEGRVTDLNFVVVPSSDRLLILPGVRRADVDATQVTSPTREGLVVVRAPNKGRAFEAATKAALAKANCAPVGRR